MKKIFSIFLALCALLSLVACNTVDGIGKDIEDAGESMQEASD